MLYNKVEKRYNKSEIMKLAWTLYKNSRNCYSVKARTFSESLADAWECAKHDKERENIADTYFDNVCAKYVELGRYAVLEAYGEWKRSLKNRDFKIDSENISAEGVAWNKAKALVRRCEAVIAIGCEIVNHDVLAEIASLDMGF